MKYLILFTFIICFTHSYAQSLTRDYEVPVISISPKGTLHLVSPEPISYVDISTNDFLGDLPLKNVLRVKLRPDSLRAEQVLKDAFLTVTGESFIAHYKVRTSGLTASDTTILQIDISPEQMKPLMPDITSLSSRTLREHALNILHSRIKRPLRVERHIGILGVLNNVYVLEDYIFLDLSYLNHTHLSYSIDDIRFSIEDRKITKASNAQSVNIEPVFTLFSKNSFQRQYRNVFVFRKLTYPGHKHLSIKLNEKQISGRTITVNIPYSDILSADVVPPLR